LESGGAGLASSTKDQFNYLYQSLNGDGTIIAQVVDVVGGDAPAEAGVMIRDSLDPGAKFAAIMLSRSYGARIQSRSTTSAVGKTTTVGSPGTSYWVKLTRDGSFFKAYLSPTGADNTWTFAGSVSLDMGHTAHVGLAVTPGDDGASTQGIFDHVTIAPTIPIGGN